MFTSKTRHWLFAAVCLPLCGCIGGEVVSYTRYDKTADSFARLELYANIETNKADELDHIAKLYKRRDRLLINVVPEFKLFSSPVLLERHGKHRCSEWPVGSAVEEEPERRTTAIDLDSIEVMPGEFFLNEYGNLCYYHQAVIPGKAVDAALRERVPQIAAELAKLAKEQIELAAKEDTRKLTWNDVREAMLESLGEREPKPDADKAGGPEMLPLDATSLRLLARAADDHLVQFTRKADVFRLLVPLSEHDCMQAIQTVELAREVIAERQKAGKPVQQELVDALKAVEVHHVENAGLRVTVQGTALWKLAACRQESMPKPNPDKKATYHSTVVEIRSRGIEVNETDLFPTVLRHFFETAERP